VHETLNEVIAMVAAELEQKRITLTLKLAADPHALVGDDVRLRQVFWNVIKNAAKFTPPDGGIRVETFIEGEQLLLRVSDTGIGMTSVELSRIFEAFSQGDHALKSGAHRFGGLGLGLAISRMMVELHSGTIGASSAGREQGATFFVRLPLPTADELTRFGSQPASTVSAPPMMAPAGRPKRILLVEDHQPTLRTLTQLLIYRKYEVLSAASLSEARNLAQGKDFELLISDIGLPDGSGYELMAELRDRPGLVGIALTGYGMESDVIRSQAAGFATQLTKPVSVQALDSALAAVIGQPTGPG